VHRQESELLDKDEIEETWSAAYENPAGTGGPRGVISS
jgi:hypothetical protein